MSTVPSPSAVPPVWDVAVRPVSWRELFAVVAGIALADATIYHGGGFTGIAALLIGLTVLFFVGASKPRFTADVLFFALLIILVSVKLIWCGFASTAVAGGIIVLILGVGLSGARFRISEICEYSFLSLFSGGARLNDYGRFVSHQSQPAAMVGLAVFLPLGALLVFGTIFILANPDLVTIIRQHLAEIGNFLSRFTNYLPDFLQGPFWILCAWILAGMLSPRRLFSDDFSSIPPPTDDSAASAERSRYYSGCRNMLLAVIVLFAVYLVFEFKTLWFRRFPAGFCYSGYSHEGAAWLAIALGLSTVILSSVFRASMLRDPRIGTLRTLAWTWSFLNIVLALAVYNRLYIYIGFNGMTRMRVVGLLGMTAVLIGFIMVVRKIAAGKSFGWLLSRFTWTVLTMLLLNCLLPVDYLVHRYNVSRILRGDLAPSVQITVHPCGSEGYLTFLSLGHCDDEIIREGVRAHLANKLFTMKRAEIDRTIGRELDGSPCKDYAWTRYQMADVLLRQQLEANREILSNYIDNRAKADEAFKRFADYAYRWY